MGRKIGQGNPKGDIDKKTGAILGATLAGAAGIAIKVIQSLGGKK